MANTASDTSCPINCRSVITTSLDEFGDSLHPIIIRPAPAFGRNPGDDLIGVGDVTGFAMYAVRRVQADALAIGLVRVIEHFVDVRGTEILARAAEFLDATRVANIRVVDDQMRRLIFFVLRS